MSPHDLVNSADLSDSSVRVPVVREVSTDRRISVSDIDQIYADNIVCDTVDIDEVAGCIIAIIVLLLWGRYWVLPTR